MGHLKMKLVPQGAIPKDPQIKLRMTPKVQAGETTHTVETIVQEAPCRPYFGGWSIGFNSDPIDFASGFMAAIAPGIGSELCGACLEWVFLGAYISTPEAPNAPVPEVTIEPHEDCQQLLVYVAPISEELPEGWSFTLMFRATLSKAGEVYDGQPFGWDAGMLLATGSGGGECVDTCPGYEFENIIGPAFFDEFSTITYPGGYDGDVTFNLRFQRPAGGSLGGSDICEGGDLSGVLFNVSVDDEGMTPNLNEGFNDPFEAQFSFNPITLSGGATATIAPTLNGEPFCDPITIQPAD